MDGEDANATEFEKRLDSLKAIGSPISFRFVPSSFWLNRSFLSISYEPFVYTSVQIRGAYSTTSSNWIC